MRWFLVLLALQCPVYAASMLESAGGVFMDSAGQKVERKPASKITAFYFSAHWCPPCKVFTPKLVEFYTATKQAGNDIEILFVSSDKSASEMEAYMKETGMPWLAVPYGSSAQTDLKAIFRGELGLKGIPSLVVLRDGVLLTKAGRKDVEMLGAAAWDKWIKMEPSDVMGPKSAEAAEPEKAGAGDPLPAPEKGEIKLSDLRSIRVDAGGKVFPVLINFVSSGEKMNGTWSRFMCAYYGGGTAISTSPVLVSEQGGEFFRELEKNCSGNPGGARKVYLYVHKKARQGCSFEALGTRYSKSKNEYGW